MSSIDFNTHYFLLSRHGEFRIVVIISAKHSIKNGEKEKEEEEVVAVTLMLFRGKNAKFNAKL